MSDKLTTKWGQCAGAALAVLRLRRVSVHGRPGREEGQSDGMHDDSIITSTFINDPNSSATTRASSRAGVINASTLPTAKEHGAAKKSLFRPPRARAIHALAAKSSRRRTPQ